MNLVRKQADEYRSRLRGLALDYYHHRISFIEFRQRMIALIGAGLAEAWLEGREKIGKRTVLTFSERIVLRREVMNETQHLAGLTQAIDRLRFEQRDVNIISRRLDLWGDAFVRTHELSVAYNGDDRMLRWVLHPAEHCVDCLRLAGQVHSARAWIRAGYTPKAWILACHQGCKCELVLTDEDERGDF